MERTYMKFFRVISFLLLICSSLSCSEFTNDPIPASEPQTAEFTITFLYFTPYAVEINSTIDNWESHNIWQSNTNTFKYTLLQKVKNAVQVTGILRKPDGRLLCLIRGRGFLIKNINI